MRVLVVKLADTIALGAIALRRAGSSPVEDTIKLYNLKGGSQCKY